jgi:hypothetical protein
MNRLLSHLARADRFLATYVDAEERRLVTQAVIVGLVVWGFVWTLRLAVHAGFEGLLWLLGRGPSVALVLVPLVLGSLVVAAIARSARDVVYFRDGDGKLHPLNTIEGDGLERAIALYFSSEPTPERTLLASEQGVRARWRLPTITLAARKWLATAVTLCTGGSGGLEASVALVGESVAAGLFKPRPLVDVVGKRARWFDHAKLRDRRSHHRRRAARQSDEAPREPWLRQEGWPAVQVDAVGGWLRVDLSAIANTKVDDFQIPIENSKVSEAEQIVQRLWSQTDSAPTMQDAEALFQCVDLGRQ